MNHYFKQLIWIELVYKAIYVSILTFFRTSEFTELERVKFSIYIPIPIKGIQMF